MSTSSGPVPVTENAGRVVLVGLGPIGIEVGKALVAHRVEILGAADPAPGIVGRELETLVAGAGAGRIVAGDAAEIYRRARAGDVAVVCTGSRLHAVAPAIEAAVDAGLSVVSTCEELAHPALRHAEIAARIDGKARARGVVVLGAGVNPGLVMDRLPLALVWGSCRVDHITIERVVDAAQRRAPLKAKVGAGLTIDAFRAGVAAGRFGHVGLAESAALIADGIGVVIGAIEETTEAVTDPATGLVLGVHQTAIIHAGGVERVRLDLKMYAGAPDPHDRIVVAGDPPLDVLVTGGFHGDRATVGATVSAVRAISEMSPGLRRATATSYS